jgi:hypothetical protein
LVLDSSHRQGTRVDTAYFHVGTKSGSATLFSKRISGWAGRRVGFTRAWE